MAIYTILYDTLGPQAGVGHSQGTYPYVQLQYYANENRRD